MKRLIFMLMTVCILVISGCKAAVTETVDSYKNAECPNDESTWAEEDIASMFSHVQKPDWDYIDCALISDNASDRIGAVLFWDNNSETSNVAFFDAEGYYQMCGVYAGTADEPDFKYLGDGTVTFKLKTAENIIYNYTLTISTDGNSVHFKAEDDLPE